MNKKQRRQAGALARMKINPAKASDKEYLQRKAQEKRSLETALQFVKE